MHRIQNLKPLIKILFLIQQLRASYFHHQSQQLVELKDELYVNTSELTEIEFNSNNSRYLCCENKIIFSKTNIEHNYNCIAFCARNIEYAVISNIIEYICSFSFDSFY